MPGDWLHLGIRKKELAKELFLFAGVGTSEGGLLAQRKTANSILLHCLCVLGNNQVERFKRQLGLSLKAQESVLSSHMDLGITSK